VVVTFVDDLGAMSELRLESSQVGGSSTLYSAQLPARDAARRVVALDVGFAPDKPIPPGAEFAIESLSTGRGELDLGRAWVSFGAGGSTRPLAPTDDNLGFRPEPDEAHIRMVPSFDNKATDYIAYPIVVSQALAGRYDLAVGDVVPVGLGKSEFGVPCRISGIIPAVPGSRFDVAFLVDSRLLVSAQLRDGLDDPDRARQFWVTAPDQLAAATTLRSELPANVRVEAIAIAPGRAVLSSAVVALWFGAGGAALLALIAIGAVVGAQMRARRPEVVILRAIGLGSRELGSLRRQELAIVLGYGMAVGLAAGATVTLLAVGALARAAVPDSIAVLRTFLRFDWLALGLSFAILSGALVAVIAAYGARVSAQARRDPNREDVQ
jgi:hypothetical protein